MKHWNHYIRLLLVGLILVIVNIIASYKYGQWDMTEDRRYSLSDSSLGIVNSVDEQIFVKVLLEGQFPAGFMRLRESTKRMLDQFRSLNPNIEYQFEDINKGSIAQINDTREQLTADGLRPTSLSYMKDSELSRQVIFPYARFYLGDRKVDVNLLEEQVAGMDEEVTLNNSVSLLEYKFCDALQKLQDPKRKNIVFTTGQGELRPEQTAALDRELRKFYNTARLDPDSTYLINPEIDLLLVLGPTSAFSDKAKFVIDQYIMNGGKVLWAIDKLSVKLDSIANNRFYVPFDYPLELDELFFKYGIKYQSNLIQDLECSRIPQVVGSAGEKPQTIMMPWPYQLLTSPIANHPIVKNIDRINTYFPGTIDTVKTNNLTKTSLLKSSKYTNYQRSPMRLSFDILQYKLEPEKFNKEPQDMAWLIEGQFTSAYKNRLTEGMENGLNQLNIPFKEESIPTKQIFISDSDFLKNLYNIEKGEISPLGYNIWERNVFIGNQQFILNAIEYLLDDNGILESRSKEVKLRLLDTVKANNEKTKWRLVNIGVPLLLLSLFGFGYNFYRRKRYA